jgi:hypothetical protein
MSRYGVDKLIRLVALEPEYLERYGNDFDGFVSQFDVEPDEARALRERDHVWLYAAGAHPQLLRRFYVTAWRSSGLTAEGYSASIASHGRPAFDT